MEGRKNSAARIRANNKYAAKAYDRINIAVPKGRKNEIKALADTWGQSINAYIISAIDEKMDRDGGRAFHGPQEAAEMPAEAGMVSLSPDMLEIAQRAADRTGETLVDFVGRAVKAQEQRDKATGKPGVNPG